MAVSNQARMFYRTSPRRAFGPKPNLDTPITRRRRFGIIGIGITAVVMNIRLGVMILGPVARPQLPPEEEDHAHQEGPTHNQRGSQCRQIPKHAGPFPVRVRRVALLPGIVTHPSDWVSPGLPSGWLDPARRRADAARRGGRGQRRRRQWARPEAPPQWARAGRGPAVTRAEGQRPAVAEAGAPGALTARTGSRPRRGVTVSSRMFHADLHIHSRFSRACSKNCDAGTLAWWAARKGVTVVGTGDFTHPAWAAELAESLEPAEPGLLRLCPGLRSELERTTPASCDPDVRFMLSAEISTIYKRDGVTRKVHHLLYAPTFEAAGTITAALAKIGNLASDGRPILGLDSRHLTEITLNAGPGCYLVPAHSCTPWFAVLGSKSGFDAVPDCYLDLADHVFAVETGLSSDPPMNWMCSALDRYRLVSNSDAHSPPMIGREATAFSTGLDYFAMLRALRTGSGLAGTINFHPEGGRYHLDGHRKCGIRFGPGQTNAHSGTCPGCGKPLTIGVLHRVSELADRPLRERPAGVAGFINLVSLPEIVGEISGSGAKSKRVIAEVDRLVATLGPELRILCETDVAALGRAGGSLLGEAIARLRRGEVITDAG